MISHTPIPIWIQTTAAPAWIGWYDHAVPAQFTMCCTQPGELAAVGSMTCEGSPAAMAGWACSSPSMIHRTPKPIRSSCRQAGSGAAGRAAWPGRSHSRALTQAMASTAKISSTMRPWCSSAARNAATSIGLSSLSPEFIPGIGLPRQVG